MISSLLPPEEDEAAKRRRERFTPKAMVITTKTSASTGGESPQASPAPTTGPKDAASSTAAADEVAPRDGPDKAIAEEDGNGKKRGVAKAVGSGARGTDKDGKADGVSGDKEAAGEKQGTKGDPRDGATMSESTDVASAEDGDADGGEGAVASNGKSGTVSVAGNGMVVPTVALAEKAGMRDVDVYKRDIAWLRSAQGMVAEVGAAMLSECDHSVVVWLSGLNRYANFGFVSWYTCVIRNFGLVPRSTLYRASYLDLQLLVGQ